MSKKPIDFIERSNLRAFLAILRDWSVIILVASFSIWANNVFVYFLSVWVIGIFQFAVGGALLHEATHYNLFKHRSWNENLDFLYGLPFLITVEQCQEYHLSHHRDLGGEQDYIPETYQFFGFTESPKNLFFLWFIKPITGFATYYLLKWCSLRPTKSGAKLVVFWLLVTALFYVSGHLDMLLLYWVVPLLWPFACLVYWFEVTEHYNTQSGTRSTVDFLTNFLFHNFGYHQVHHLYPTIPWYRLPEAHEQFCQARPDISQGFFNTYRQLGMQHLEVGMKATP